MIDFQAFIIEPAFVRRDYQVLLLILILLVILFLIVIFLLILLAFELPSVVFIRQSHMDQTRANEPDQAAEWLAQEKE